ncbi:MAG: PAC2 family protein [Fibrobacterota bacterium]|nr:PAC2 family protein [Chitinispirillaceae bacterium]
MMKTLETIEFKKPPTVLAAWPGMGNVGLITVDYLRRKLDARLFAEIDMSPFFIPDSIVVKNGISQFPEIPTAVFYYTNNPDLIIFESNAQISGKEGIMIIKTILDVIMQYPVQHVFTFAAFAQPMSFTDDSQVLVTCNIPEFLIDLQQHGLTPMPDGYIAGLNGLLLGVAASRQIESACMLGTIPGYAVNLSYPKASLQLIQSISKFLDFTVDLAEIKENINNLSQQLSLIEDRIRDFSSAGAASHEDEQVQQELEDIEQEKVPQYVMEKIERMFNDAKSDKAIAADLKKELDRWNLFELYENRFLDLFK